MTKRLAIYATLLALLTLAWAATHYYSTEMSAVLWHVRHGSHAEVNGIRVPVPLAYESPESPGLPTLLMIRTAGHAWHGGGMIEIDFYGQSSPEASRLLGSKAMSIPQFVREQTATFAGKPGKCLEGIPQTGNAQLQKLIREQDLLEIDCAFGGEVEITFRGTASLEQEFYSVIQGAVPVQGKH